MTGCVFMLVYILLAEGFEESEAVVPADLLSRAGAQVRFVSASVSKDVEGSHGIHICADDYIDEIDMDAMEAVILPGGGKGTALLAADSRVISIIDSAFKQGKYICTICAAPSILASMGLLDGRKATCYPSFSKYLEKSIYTGADTERDDIFITGKAAGTAYQFALKIVQALFGDSVSDKIKNDICL